MTRTQALLALFFGLLMIYSVAAAAVNHHRPSVEGENLYVKQAAAFLRGEVAIDSGGHDAAHFDGQLYVAFPPAPALLLTPLVALLGREGVNTVAVAGLLGLVGLWAVWRILGQLAVPNRLQFWLILGFFLGSPLWLALLWSWGVWYFAHVVAVIFLLLAVQEALGRGRGWLVGSLLAVAVLSRQMTLFAGIFLLAALWQQPAWAERRWWKAMGFVLPLALAGIGYLLFNAVRFGDPLQTGYGFLHLDGFLLARVWNFGLFSPAYLFTNAYRLFVQGFHLTFTDARLMSGLTLNPHGTSLLAASPFVLAAFFAPRSRLTGAAWIAIAGMIGVTLFYYNDGWVQHNAQRFTLDFWPLLLVVIALGLKEQARQGQVRLWQGFIIYAVSLNLFALLLIDPLNRLLPLWYGLFR
jgi:hypothetical protein